jgi:beta-glucanase (GH16 family)
VPTDCAGTTPPIAPPSGTWACTFDDEFNGTSLDASKWQPQLTATSDYTTGYGSHLVCYVDNPQTISESGGTLNLSIVHTPDTACPGLQENLSRTSYEGGDVSSYQLFSQKYGFFEARAEMPATTVQGLQETLWLYPEDENLYGPWPDSGEIDYAEFYSIDAADDFPVVRYPGYRNDPNSSSPNGCGLSGVSAAGQFNTYALSWTPTTLTVYFNGVPCISDVYAPYVTSPDTAPEPFNQPFFLAFTAALGPSYDNLTSATPLPATTKIDWMRAWQYG